MEITMVDYGSLQSIKNKKVKALDPNIYYRQKM